MVAASLTYSPLLTLFCAMGNNAFPVSVCTCSTPTTTYCAVALLSDCAGDVVLALVSRSFSRPYIHRHLTSVNFVGIFLCPWMNRSLSLSLSAFILLSPSQARFHLTIPLMCKRRTRLTTAILNSLAFYSLSLTKPVTSSKLDRCSTRQHKSDLLPIWGSSTDFLLRPSSITKLPHLLSGISRTLSPHTFQNYFTPTTILGLFRLATRENFQINLKSAGNRFFPFQAANSLPVTAACRVCVCVRARACVCVVFSCVCEYGYCFFSV